MSFEEYLNINYNENLDDLTKFLINDAYKAGVESRQAEIDELQKRIDEALDYADGVHSENWQETINTMLYILKGKNND